MFNKNILIIIIIFVSISCKDNSVDKNFNGWKNYVYKDIIKLDSLERPVNDSIIYFPDRKYLREDTVIDKFNVYSDCLYGMEEPIMWVKYFHNDMYRIFFPQNDECIRFIKKDNVMEVIIKNGQCFGCGYEEHPQYIIKNINKYECNMTYWDTLTNLINNSKFWEYYKAPDNEISIGSFVLEGSFKDKYCYMSSEDIGDTNRNEVHELLKFIYKLKEQLINNKK